MQAVLLTFVIGLLNLALGYALAVSLGFGPPMSASAWMLLGPRRPVEKTRGAGIGEPLEEQHPKQPPPSAAEATLPAAAQESSGPVPEPEPEAIDPDAFREFVAKSTASLTDFVARLKKSNRNDQQRSAWSFVAELQPICQAYLDKLKLAAERLSDQLGDAAEELVLEQAAQLETTLSNLQYMNFDSGASAAMERLVQDTGNTLSMAHRLQQALQAPPGTSGQEASEESPQSSRVGAAGPAWNREVARRV